VIARLKAGLWRHCLAAYRAKPVVVVPVLHDRCCLLVERCVLTEIKMTMMIIIIITIIKAATSGIFGALKPP